MKQRVIKGGHNIPDDVQQRRFHLGIRHLTQLYRPLIDWWRLYDNTVEQPAASSKSTAPPLPEAEERALLAHLKI